MKRLVLILLVALLVVPVSVNAGSIGGKDNPGGVPGQWYVGDTPSFVDPNKPPIVFIHGINSSSRTWWENNNMYQTALTNGYQTAFIDVHPDKNMWDNGAIVNSRIRDIYNHFGQKKLVIVAHSKGGIDSQNALVHHGAHPYVSNLITLSTPHYGSQLADLAYSGWASWLASILGSKNDATYSLQTGYMNSYRPQIDNHTNRSRNRVYTLAGTSWGSFGSSLYWGGLYLNSYGSNDGAVTVTSSRLPYSTEVLVSNWNHTTVREGVTFQYFRPYLTLTQAAGASFALDEVSATVEPREEEAISISTLHRGGEFQTEGKETFSVEENVAQIDLDWLSDKQTTDIEIISPSGKIHTNFQHSIDREIFQGGHHHTFQITKPEQGEWTVKAKKEQATYLMTVGFHSELNEEIVLEEATLELKNTGAKVKDFEVDVNIQKDGKAKSAYGMKVAKKGKVALNFTEEGVYSITLDVKGKTKNGNNFERTIVKSLYIDKNGNKY
ncbi:lipase family alpha/beta hydrolase [Sutcliffiella halmapala]|uniref:lipase family alpha/beta hydrolase n=1 Tax=Sutcliffiella halmapala TaxID=79882 RepID=UPI0009957BF3|nr:alpha/beta fold hydrolase [Sutcliffiella halmapala]